MSDTESLRAQHVQEWREAARTVARTYKEWCAASRSDGKALYVSFLEALTREERAALQVSRDTSLLGATDPAS